MNYFNFVPNCTKYWPIFHRQESEKRRLFAKIVNDDDRRLCPTKLIVVLHNSTINDITKYV